MLNVLCLPGYYTNKEMLTVQLRNFKKYFQKQVEFTVIDPPFTFSERELLEADEATLKFCAKTKTQPLNWLTYTHISQGPGHLEVFLDKAVDFLLDYLRASPLKFDGIYGFSQGGLILDYLFFKAALPNSNIPKYLLPRFAIINAPNYLGYSGDVGKWKRVDIPLVFLIGELDRFFMRNCLMSVFYERPTIIFHKEGHKVPSLDDEQIEKMREFFKEMRPMRGKL